MILDKLKQALPPGGRGPQHILALDIGTEFIKALIAEIDGDELKIIGVGREHQGLSDMHSGAIADIGAVVRNCEAALSDAEQQAGIQAKKVVIGIAGERPESDQAIGWHIRRYLCGCDETDYCKKQNADLFHRRFFWIQRKII